MKKSWQTTMSLSLMVLVTIFSGCKGPGASDSSVRAQGDDSTAASQTLDPNKFVEFEPGRKVGNSMVIYISDIQNAIFTLADSGDWENLATCHSGKGKFALISNGPIDPDALNPVDFLSCDTMQSAPERAAFTIVNSPLGDSAIATLTDNSGNPFVSVGVSRELADLINRCASKYGQYTIKNGQFLKSFSCINAGAPPSGTDGMTYRYELAPAGSTPLAAVVELNGTKIGWLIDATNANLANSLSDCKSRSGRFTLKDVIGSAYSTGPVNWKMVTEFECATK